MQHLVQSLSTKSMHGLIKILVSTCTSHTNLRVAIRAYKVMNARQVKSSTQTVYRLPSNVTSYLVNRTCTFQAIQTSYRSIRTPMETKLWMVRPGDSLCTVSVDKNPTKKIKSPYYQWHADILPSISTATVGRLQVTHCNPLTGRALPFIRARTHTHCHCVGLSHTNPQKLEIVNKTQ